MATRSFPRSASPSRLALVLVGLGLVLVVAGRLAAVAQRAPARPSSLLPVTWEFPATPLGPLRAVALVPARRSPGERLPLLVALHGSGEARRGVARGAWGWARDYELGASDHELRRARLRAEAFLGFVAPARLAALRRDLAARPYRGVVVVTPYTPLLPDDGGAVQRAFAAWVVGTLVPRARASLPVLSSREATGIDGVSLGGLHALATGLAHPETFGVVGALQAAVDGREESLAALAPRGGLPQRVRLVTTRADPLRPAVLALHAALLARGFAHELRVLEGPHDYVFNRGAGGVEMLLFHDRALRGLPAE